MSERQPSKAERARVERWYDKMCRETNAALEERDHAVAENAQLKTELGAYQRRVAERDLAYEERDAAYEERDAAKAEVERMKVALGTYQWEERARAKDVAIGMAVGDVIDVLRFAGATLAVLEHFRNVLGKASYPDLVANDIKFTRGEIARSLRRLDEARERVGTGVTP